MLIDVVHPLDLYALFDFIILVETDGVYPELNGIRAVVCNTSLVPPLKDCKCKRKLWRIFRMGKEWPLMQMKGCSQDFSPHSYDKATYEGIFGPENVLR